MPIILPPLLRIQLNQRIDPHDRNASLNRTLQLPHLTHGRFQDSQLDAIDAFPVLEIEAVVLVPAVLGYGFGVGGDAAAAMTSTASCCCGCGARCAGTTGVGG